MPQERCGIRRWWCRMHSDRKESTGIGDKTSIPLSFILYLPDWGKSFACYRRVNFSFIPYAGQHAEEEEEN